MNCPSVQCPQTQASVHNAKETFILGFQRHQSQCAEPVNLSKATVPGYFIIDIMRLVFRSSWAYIQAVIQAVTAAGSHSSWSETPTLIVAMSGSTPGILTCLTSAAPRQCCAIQWAQVLLAQVGVGTPLCCSFSPPPCPLLRCNDH